MKFEAMDLPYRFYCLFFPFGHPPWDVASRYNYKTCLKCTIYRYNIVAICTSRYKYKTLTKQQNIHDCGVDFFNNINWKS